MSFNQGTTASALLCTKLISLVPSSCGHSSLSSALVAPLISTLHSHGLFPRFIFDFGLAVRPSMSWEACTSCTIDRLRSAIRTLRLLLSPCYTIVVNIDASTRDRYFHNKRSSTHNQKMEADTTLLASAARAGHELRGDDRIGTGKVGCQREGRELGMARCRWDGKE